MQAVVSIALAPIHNRPMRFRFVTCFLLMSSLMLGCAPAQEWRSVPLPALGLKASLPCKPDRAERSVELAGTEVEVLMQGCESGNNTFAVACATLVQPATAGAALNHWRAAVLAASKARDTHDTPFQPAGALGLPQSVRTRAIGALPNGGDMHMDAVWFSRVQGSTVRACHAMVYGPALTAAIADVFFDGLTLM